MKTSGRRHSRAVARPFLAMGWVAACLAAANGCRGRPEAAVTPPPAPLVETASSGPVACRIEAESEVIPLDRDLLLTLQTRAPEGIEVRLPPLESRLTGFVPNGAYDREPVVRDGVVVRERCVRLTPTLVEEYRLGPLAVAYTDRRVQPAVEGWFPTRPLVFKAAPVVAGPPPAALADILGPIHVYPPFKTVLGWIALGLLGVAALAGLWFAGRRIHRAVRLRLMSPKERALHELAELLARDLVGRRQLKEFYLAITLIVRRYIERAHAIRAPELTTEEFLVAVAHNPRFRRDTLFRLKAFLQTADLVKFAAFRPDPAAVDRTVATARDYLETDEQECRQRETAHA